MNSPTQSFYSKPEDCPICYEHLKQNNPLKCGHWAHNKCVEKWSLLYHHHILCPICKTKLKKINKVKILSINNKPIKSTDKYFIKKILSKLLPVHL